MSVAITTPTPTPIPAPPATAKRQRITSLDWARGWMVLANLVVIAFLYPSWDQLSHTQWMGVTVFDLIFPTFVSLSGCGLAFAYARPRRPPGDRATGGSALRSGSALQRSRHRDVQPAGTPDCRALTGVRRARPGGGTTAPGSPRYTPWAVATVALATVWTAVSWAYNSRCPTGQPTRSCNLYAAIDLRLIPAEHLYRHGSLGHDPEGLAAIVGALITMMVGVTSGKILLARTSPRVTLDRLVAWLIGVALLGVLAAQFVAPFKRIWTPSFTLLTSTIGLTMLIIGYALHDRPAPPWSGESVKKALAQPLVAMGRNALLLYFGSHIVIHELYVVGDPPLAVRIPGIEPPRDRGYANSVRLSVRLRLLRFGLGTASTPDLHPRLSVGRVGKLRTRADRRVCRGSQQSRQGGGVCCSSTAGCSLFRRSSAAGV